MSNSELNQRRLAATPRGVGVMCDFFAERAKNATLWDSEGREFTDFAAGIAVLNTGHRHPKIIAAVEEQLARFTHTSYQVVPYASFVTLAEKINAVAPVAGPVKSTFFSTGAEALENAIKIARAYTGRPGVITFGGAFHGRTLLTLALTGKVAPYKLGFGPLPGQIFHAQYPNTPMRCMTFRSRRRWPALNACSAPILPRITWRRYFSSRYRARAALISRHRNF